MSIQDTVESIRAVIKDAAKALDKESTTEVKLKPSFPVVIGRQKRAFALDLTEPVRLTPRKVDTSGGVALALDRLADIVAELEQNGNGAGFSPEQLAELDSGVLLQALRLRIDRERKEKIAGATSTTIWPKPFLDALRNLLLLAPAMTTGTAAPIQAPGRPVTDAREPWPFGGVSGDSRNARDFPSIYQPPEGYDWTGEFRQPTRDDAFISSAGVVNVRGGDPRRGILRPIIRPLGEGEQPSFGLGSAPASEAASDDPRKPWKAQGYNEFTSVRPRYEKQFQPPAGYEWTNLFRRPRPNEPFLDVRGTPSAGSPRPDRLRGRRVILKKLRPGEKPKLGLPRQRPAATTPAQPKRKPWPGTPAIGSLGTEVRPTDQRFAEIYDPPTGYDWIGFRGRQPGDLFLNDTGRVERGRSTSSDKRHIVTPVGGTIAPSSGARSVGAA